MMPGVCACTFEVLKTAPAVSISFAKISFRVGSSPGSVISRTRGMTNYTAASARPLRMGRQVVLDRRQRVEHHVADDGEAPRGQLVERVVCRVPGRIVKADQQPRLPAVLGKRAIIG